MLPASVRSFTESTEFDRDNARTQPPRQIITNFLKEVNNMKIVAGTWPLDSLSKDPNNEPIITDAVDFQTNIMIIYTDLESSLKNGPMEFDTNLTETLVLDMLQKYNTLMRLINNIAAPGTVGPTGKSRTLHRNPSYDPENDPKDDHDHPKEDHDHDRASQPVEPKELQEPPPKRVRGKAAAKSKVNKRPAGSDNEIYGDATETALFDDVDIVVD